MPAETPPDIPTLQGRVAALEAEAARLRALLAEGGAPETPADAAAPRSMLLDMLPNFIWLADRDGWPTWLNRHWYDYTGQDPAEALGGAHLDAVHPEDRAAVEAAWQAALRLGEPFEHAMRMRRRDGTARWFLSRSNPLRGPDGSIIGWFGSSTDIHAQKSAEDALARSEARLQLAQEAAGVGVYERDLIADRALWTPVMFRLWGLDPDGRSPWITDEDYRALILPDDSDEHRARRDAMRNDPSATRFSYEFRIRRPDTGEVRWLVSRGEYVRDESGRAVLVRGTNHDVTDRKEDEARQMLLMREVDHRAKNALAVVQAALRLTPKDDMEAFCRAVEGRVAALARAQTMLAEERWAGADLRTLLTGELAAFLADQRVELSGPPVALPAEAAQPLAMAVHELATNAVKHGALSQGSGALAVTWAVSDAPGTGGRLGLRWAESGGPRIAGAPARRGFGSRVLEATLGTQLGGAVRLDWQPAGLVCEIEVPLRRRAG